MSKLSRELYLTAIGRSILRGESVQTFPLADIKEAKGRLPVRVQETVQPKHAFFNVTVTIDENDYGLVSFSLHNSEGKVIGKGESLTIAAAALEMGAALYEATA